MRPNVCSVRSRSVTPLSLSKSTVVYTYSKPAAQRRAKAYSTDGDTMLVVELMRPVSSVPGDRWYARNLP